MKGTQKFNMAVVFWLIFANLCILIIIQEDATFESLGILHSQNCSSVELYRNGENTSWKIKVVLPIIPKGNPHSSHFHSSFSLFKSSSLICFSKLPSSLLPSYPLMTNSGDSCWFPYKIMKFIKKWLEITCVKKLQNPAMNIFISIVKRHTTDL